MSRLDKYGIRGTANIWVQSYLSDRKQEVSVKNNVRSRIIHVVNTAIAQGNILNPNLFIIYTNHLAIDYLMINYADDTNVLIHGALTEKIKNTTTTSFSGINKWFAMNTLVVDKSKTILIYQTRKSIVST